MAKRKSGRDMIAEAQAAFNRAPVRGGATGKPARAAPIPASRGVQTMGRNQSTAMTPAPRSALDQTSGLMTGRQTERLAGRVRDTFAMQPSRPTAVNATPEPKLRIPEMRERSLPVPYSMEPRGLSGASAGTRVPRRGPRGRGLGGAVTNVLGAYAIGAGAATPAAVQVEVEMRRRRKEYK